MQMQSHIKVHLTEISQLSHDRKARHCVLYDQKGHILTNLGRFEDETSLKSMPI